MRRILSEVVRRCAFPHRQPLVKFGPHRFADHPAEGSADRLKPVHRQVQHFAFAGRDRVVEQLLVLSQAAPSEDQLTGDPGRRG